MKCSRGYVRYSAFRAKRSEYGSDERRTYCAGFDRRERVTKDFTSEYYVRESIRRFFYAVQKRLL